MGRHRSTGRHRAPAVPHPRRRLMVVCGCALCAAVIPLFAQHTPASNPPDLTSAPTLTAVAPVAPPTFTLQPRTDTVDMVSAVTGELAKHHDNSSDDNSTSGDTGKSDSPKSGKSENQKVGKSAGQDTSPDPDTGSHPHKDSEDSTRPTACQ